MGLQQREVPHRSYFQAIRRRFGSEFASLGLEHVALDFDGARSGRQEVIIRKIIRLTID